MPTVYVVQDPQGKEISVAREFGPLKVLLKGTETAPAAIEKLVRILQNIEPGDFILQIGHPINIGLATHFALLFSGGNLNVLVWRRESYRYIIEEIRLDECDKSAYTAAFDRLGLKPGNHAGQ